MKLLIENARFLEQPDSVSSLAIADGKIVHLGNVPATFMPDQRLNASQAWCLPGLVELNGYLREPGYSQKGSLKSELGAALRGGVTSVCCTPLTRPVNDTAAVTRLIQERARENSAVRVFPVGAMTQGLAGEQLSEMWALKEAGCVALTQLSLPFANHRVMKRCLEYAASHDITVCVVPQDEALAADGCVHEGAIASRLGLPGIPDEAETLAVSQWLMLAESTEARLHLSGLSSRRSVELLREARSRGSSVTADVALANLLYTEECIEDFDSRFHVRPPLRRESDRQALLDAVLTGVIDAISTHHQPHEQAALLAPFAETEPGMSLLQAWPSLLWHLCAGDHGVFRKLVAASSGQAAALYGIPAGQLEAGCAADLFLFDEARTWSPGEGNWSSGGRNHPFDASEKLAGLVTTVLVDGNIAYDES